MNEFLRIQLDYLLYIQHLREVTSYQFDGLFLFITSFAEYIIPTLLITFFYWIYNKRFGTFFALNLCLSVFFNQLFKLIACIYRPWILDSRIQPVPQAMEMASGYSFPSGHTATAVVVWGTLARILKSKKFICSALILLILAIGFSRNYLGVHTPQDVLVSLLVGTAIIFAGEKILDWVDKKPNNDLIAYFIYILAIVGLIIYANVKPYPMDYIDGKLIVDPYKVIKDIYPLTGMVIGFATGLIIDRRFIKYEISGSWTSKIIKYVIGNTLLILAFAFAKPAFISILGYKIGYFCFNFLLGMYITALYPFILSKIKA